MDYSLLSKKTQKRGMQVINANPNVPGTKSKVAMPKKKPKHKYSDAKGNITNLKTKKASYKAMGGMAKYYKDGGEVMTGREGLTAAQKTLPDFLQKKILQAKKKK